MQEMSMKLRGAAICVLVLALGGAVLPAGATSEAREGINAADVKEWLSYIASDELQGRDTFSAGLGLAAAYIEDHLRPWGVKPGGDAGSYLQVVRVLGVKSTSHSSVTVNVRGQTRVFGDGAGVTFPRNPGGKRTVVARRVEFAGYGLDLPAEDHMDFRGKDVNGAAVVWLGSAGPKTVDAKYRRVLTSRARYATDDLKALASVGPASQRGGAGQGTPAAPGTPPPDFTTAQRLDNEQPPRITAGDEFFTFLFSKAPVSYEELKRKADAQDPLPSFKLDDVTLTFNVDTTYEVVRTQLTHNVIGIVEGSDPVLKNSYVVIGAHYDHVGYAEAEVSDGSTRPAAPGRVTAGAVDDRIWNGADDDGSGTVAVMALAKAFAQGPRPKRSLVFIWHAGEERGLYGSRYFADYPTVPIGNVVAKLNIDMIGRNRDNKSDEANTLYLVGSDRISSELHEISREANRALPQPMTLDYEMNDPSDVEQIYYRSDHYSYASKGIPVIFFTTGLHPDYHANTDEVSKIEFGKLTHVAQLVYEIADRLADLDHPPVRDNKGPRAGKDTR
jgi:hypothetical protein